MKERMLYMDFTRAMCALGIVIYHVNCHISNRDLCYFFSTPSGLSFGEIIVTMFFIMSGATLFYNNSEIKSLKIFYYKRWKSIFPMFLFAYSIIFTINVINTGELFWNHEVDSWTLVLTLFGVDGYFSSLIPNYYLIGEWFLGALVILYVLYPLIIKIIEKKPVITVLLVVALYTYFLFISNKNYSLFPFRYITTCCMSFTLGIILMKYAKILYGIKVTIMLSMIFILLMVIPYPKFQNSAVLFTQIEGVLLIFIMNYIGQYLMNTKLSAGIRELSNISFPIFLVQHIIILRVLNSFPTNNVYEVIFISILCVILSIIEAKLLSVIVNNILKSNYYHRFESYMIGDKVT